MLFLTQDVDVDGGVSCIRVRSANVVEAQDSPPRLVRRDILDESIERHRKQVICIILLAENSSRPVLLSYGERIDSARLQCRHCPAMESEINRRILVVGCFVVWW